jgi:hypothetical protein
MPYADQQVAVNATLVRFINDNMADSFEIWVTLILMSATINGELTTTVR